MTFIPAFIRRLLLPVIFIFTLISHTFTLFIPDYHSLLANSLSKLIPDIRTPYSEIADLKSKNTQLKNKNLELNKDNDELKKKYTDQTAKNKASKQISKDIASRLLRNVSINTSSVLVESVPYLGVGTIIGVTAMDINDACNTMKDVNRILKNIGEEPDINTATKICKFKEKIPSREQIANYWENKTKTLKAAAERQQNKVKEHVGDIKHDLGGFIDHLIERSKARWKQIIDFIMYLIFEYKR